MFNNLRRIDRQFVMFLQRFRQRQRTTVNGDGLIAFQPQQPQQLLNQQWVIFIPHAQSITRLVAQTGITEINFNMPHVFIGVAAGNFLVNGKTGGQGRFFAVRTAVDLIHAARRGGSHLEGAGVRHTGLQHLNDLFAPGFCLRGILHVGINALQQTLTAQFRQLAVEIFTGLAEEFVRGVPQTKHRKRTTVHFRRFFRHQELMQCHGFFRRLALTLRGGHHHQQFFLTDLLKFVVTGIDQVNVQLFAQQIVAQLFGQATRVAGLRCGKKRNGRHLNRRCAGDRRTRRLIDHAPEVTGKPCQLSG